jgi:hypothetical protein
MPKFLEQALRHEAAKKGLRGKHADRYVFGAMNNIGAVKGNKITPKGEAMEKKHMADEKAGKKPPFSSTRITHHDDGSHSVQHEPHMKMKPGGAFMERGDGMSYSAGNGKELVSKLSRNLKIGTAQAQGEAQQDHEPVNEVQEEEEQGE